MEEKKNIGSVGGDKTFNTCRMEKVVADSF